MSEKGRDVFERLSTLGLMLEDREQIDLHRKAAKHFEAAAVYENKEKKPNTRYEYESAEYCLDQIESVEEIDKGY